MSEHNLPPGIYEKPGLIVKVLPGGGWIPVATYRTMGMGER